MFPHLPMAPVIFPVNIDSELYCARICFHFFEGKPAIMSVNAIREAPEATADNLQALEQKIYRTIELLKTAREATTAAERDSGRLREQLEMREEELETLRSENMALRREREDVRSRVEKLLGQIEALAEE